MVKKYLQEMESEYKKMCGAYARFLSYISKIKEAEDINPDEMEMFEKARDRFVKKIAYMNNFLKEH